MSLTLNDDHPFFRYSARYGVPLLLVVFYVTASFHFAYTPDSTFGSLVHVRTTGVGSLWQLFLATSQLLQIDGILATKILSMLFTSISVLLGFLIAHEVLRERRLAFCAALTFSMQAWMLQLAPSGSGLSLALVLGLLSIFFLLRNEYIIAAIATALASLVVWQAALLLVVLMLDASMNSKNPGRSHKLIATIAMIFGSGILPWVLYSFYVGAALIPNELVDGAIDLLSPQVLFELVLFVGLMFVAVVWMASRHRTALRMQSPLILWIVVASFAHRQMFVVTLPLIIVYAFFAIHTIIETFGKKNLGYLGVLVFTGLSLAYNQFVVWPATQRAMESTVIVTDEVRAVAMWVSVNVGQDDEIRAPSGHEGLVRLYAQRNLGGDAAGILISNLPSINGYDVTFDPLQGSTDAARGSSHYRVWRKR